MLSLAINGINIYTIMNFHVIRCYIGRYLQPTRKDISQPVCIYKEGLKMNGTQQLLVCAACFGNLLGKNMTC
jgi:hypothetical protein